MTAPLDVAEDCRLAGAFDQAGVAVGEEAVAVGNGVGVGGFYMVEAGQGGDQHQQG